MIETEAMFSKLYPKNVTWGFITYKTSSGVSTLTYHTLIRHQIKCLYIYKCMVYNKC